MTATDAVVCWSFSESGQPSTPQVLAGLESDVASIAMGSAHVCAVTTAGAVKCAGSNRYGQLGNGSTDERSVATQVSGLASGVAAVAAGYGHSCAVTTAGAAMCWGDNEDGQLGDGTYKERLVPTAVSGLSSGVASIEVGDAHSCVVTTAGAAKCWGSNFSDGQVGDGTRTSRPAPVGVSGLSSGVRSISAGYRHTCAVTVTNDVMCWGANDEGQLGDGTTSKRYVPTTLTALSGTASISAGTHHTCAVTTKGSVRCWGDNAFDQLGDGSETDQFSPVPVSSLAAKVSAVASGDWHTCALTTGGGVVCWGTNVYGQLGDGTTTTRPTPVAVSGLSSGVKAISAGSAHTCAVTVAGTVKCWGSNLNGQLGDGTSDNRMSPVAVKSLSGVVAVAAGYSHSCAVTDVGAVKCWGSNDWGALGDGSSKNRLTPVTVSGLSSGVIAIASGSSHMCALTTAGSVHCWGDNSLGQVGDGSTTNRSTPVAVSGLSFGASSISAGLTHSCAVRTNGALRCWGGNYSGQLGDGSNTNRSTPVAVSGLSSGVRSVTVGGFHTCAVTTADDVWCWGANSSGQIGDGSNYGLPRRARLARTLTVATTGRGSGTIVSSPAGIDCGSSCSATFGDGRSVTLTATAASGSRLRGWSGACRGRAATCTVSMSKARAVTARFAREYTLTVTTQGRGSGSIVSSPGKIECGTTCTASFLAGRQVTLTATPAPGSRFRGWSGACTGTARTCTVSMTATRTVTATFSR